jgi:hypothetical protein
MLESSHESERTDLVAEGEQGMNHLEFAASESAALLPTAWEKWIEKAEKLAGHHLDGDQSVDGYSLDGAFEAWKGGLSPEVYTVLCGLHTNN